MIVVSVLEIIRGLFTEFHDAYSHTPREFGHDVTSRHYRNNLTYALPVEFKWGRGWRMWFWVVTFAASIAFAGMAAMLNR